MLMIQFWAGVLYLLGALGFAFIKLGSIKKQYPNEAAELKVFRKYWIDEWPSFGLTTVGLFVWVLVVPELLGREIMHYEVSTLFKAISVVVGIGNQGLWLALFGVSKIAAEKLHMEKKREEGKQEGRDETLSKLGDAAPIN